MTAFAPSLLRPGAFGRRRGFTLIEIMVVVAIMAIVLSMGVPLVYRLVKKEPMRQAVSDIIEICSEARARAILRGSETKLVFRPDGSITIGGGEAAPTRPAAPGGEMTPPPEMVSPKSGAASGSVRLGDSIAYELLTKDHVDYRDQESMSVSFRPNGTCDEMVLVLLSHSNERVKIWLEVTTALGFVEWDPAKF